MELLQNLQPRGATICMVTHDPRFAKHAQREVHLFRRQSSGRRRTEKAEWRNVHA